MTVTARPSVFCATDFKNRSNVFGHPLTLDAGANRKASPSVVRSMPAGQIDRCVADANAYYRIGFDPPVAGHADEYHELKVAPDRPGLTVRTTTGYYDEQAGAATGAQ